MKKFRVGLLGVLGLLFLSGCAGNIVPSQYDIKLKTKVSSITAELGGSPGEIEVTVDSRRYQELSSEQSIFLSYHLLSPDGQMLAFDNERSTLEPIEARGVKKEKLNYTAPVEAGNYLLQIDIVEEGVTWFSAQGMPTLEIPLIVEESYEPPYAETVLHSGLPEIETAAGDRLEIPLSIENTGNTPIYSMGMLETKVSYHVEDTKGNMLIFDGERTRLESMLEPGARREIVIPVAGDILNTPGQYVLRLDLVIEGRAWYSEHGMKTADIPITVEANGLQKNEE